jgi:DNA-binding response OmpR family regulator
MRHEQAILIVEDDDDIREAMSAFLEAEGYPVIQAKDGEEGLRTLRSTAQRFCLVLLDLFMPVKNGWEFRAEQLRDPAIASVPVVIVSADRSAKEKAANLGAIDCMVKPIDFTRLLDTVATLC